MKLGSRVRHRWTNNYGTIVAAPRFATRTVRWDGSGVGDYPINELKEVPR